MQRLKDELSKLKNSYILMENQVNEANKAKNLIEVISSSSFWNLISSPFGCC